jgi:ribosomal protein L14
MSTPIRTVRVPDDVWQAAQDRAAKKGETVSAVIVRALKRYGKK